MKGSGLEKVEDLLLELVSAVASTASVYLTRRTIQEAMFRAIPHGISQEMSVEARTHIFAVSRSQFYRDRQKPEPDQYSVLQLIGDCLCPIYPAGLTSRQILGSLADFRRNLSIEQLEEILAFYQRQGILEKAGEEYRLRSSLVWMGDELAGRAARAIKYCPAVVQNLVSYLLQEREAQFSVVRIYGTPEEYDDFMAGLKQYVTDWFARHPELEGEARPSYQIHLLSTLLKR